MAEATDPEALNPFDVEVLMLLRDETETTEKRLKAMLAKDVKVEQKDATKPLVTKPVWPYVMWHVNCLNYADSSSEFNRQTRHRVPLSYTRESNQPDQMSNRDHSSSIDTTIDSCESKLVCKANPEKESMPNTEAIDHKPIRPLSMDDMTDLLQRSINMLSDLQDLLSIGVEKYFSKDTGKNETDSMIAEDKQTQRTLEGGERVQEMGPWTMYEKDENSRFEAAVEENLQLPYTDDKSTPVGLDVSLNESSEKVTPISQNKVYRKENIEKETNDLNLKSILKSVECEEVLRTRAAEKQVSTFKVHHFKTELQSPVSAQSVLYKTITKWLPSISIDLLVKTEHIKQLVRSLMNNTVQELQTKHKIFSKCYIIETGSMAEGTKIGQPDEFDFMIALPMLADSDVAELLYIKLGIQTRLHDDIRDQVLSFLCQFSFVDSSYRHYLTNAYLLQVFRETVRKHLPVGWTMREESDIHMMRVYLKNQTLTLHLQCESGHDAGFILSIDVCYGIPLNAERLQTIYVADHTHALHLSFVQSECLRMNTGVLAVISRNPLVAERFFFQTEPYKFHGNKLAADCYKLAKHVARSFLPKINKNNCSLCEDTLIPSFYMKTVVSFMMDFYTETNNWCETQLGNRLIEIFEIMSYSFLHEYKALAYYTYINSMKLDFKMKYYPGKGSIKVGIGMDDEKPCTIPRMEDLNLASSRVEIRTAVQSYWQYMKDEEWAVGDLLQKLTELLYVLKFTETDCKQSTHE